MIEKEIEKISLKEFGHAPHTITRKTIGRCNEVYELNVDSESYIIRLNREKEWIYGTRRFLPIFQKLDIKTPDIIAEDYTKHEFAWCYQIQNKIAGKDLGLVFGELSISELKQIAGEISDIFDKFNTLPQADSFGMMTGLNEHKYDSLYDNILQQVKDTRERNKMTQVLDQEVIEIQNDITNTYKSYFQNVQPRLYYDDICSKNVMIHNGQFNGLVDLDFLIKGDCLEAIGRNLSSWHGEEHGEMYVNEIVRLQKLDTTQEQMIKVYAILNWIGWTSEEGMRTNGNSTGQVNWPRVEKLRQQIKEVYASIEG